MKFEWDPIKSAANNTKHGMDFETAKDLWRDENRIEIHVPYHDEERFIIVGKSITNIGRRFIRCETLKFA